MTVSRIVADMKNWHIDVSSRTKSNRSCIDKQPIDLIYISQQNRAMTICKLQPRYASKDSSSFLSGRENLQQCLTLFRCDGIFQHLMSTVNDIILDTLLVKDTVAESQPGKSYQVLIDTARVSSELFLHVDKFWIGGCEME